MCQRKGSPPCPIRLPGVGCTGTGSTSPCLLLTALGPTPEDEIAGDDSAAPADAALAAPVPPPAAAPAAAEAEGAALEDEPAAGAGYQPEAARIVSTGANFKVRL